MVVIETGGRPVVIGGDVALWFRELDEPHKDVKTTMVHTHVPNRGGKGVWSAVDGLGS